MCLGYKKPGERKKKVKIIVEKNGLIYCVVTCTSYYNGIANILMIMWSFKSNNQWRLVAKIGGGDAPEKLIPF